MDGRRLIEFIEMIEDYIEEPHSLSPDWVELLKCAKDMFEKELRREDMGK